METREEGREGKEALQVSDQRRELLEGVCQAYKEIDYMTNTLTKLFDRVAMTEASYKGIVTKFDNKGSFYFSYVDKAKKVFEVKKASIKYYYSETLQKGIAFLNGAFKDALPIVYTSERKSPEGVAFLMCQSVEAYSDKDRLPELHAKVLEALSPIIQRSLKASLKEGKLYSEGFFRKCSMNGAREIGTTYEDKEGFRKVVSLSTVQGIGIFRAFEKMSPEDAEALKPILSEMNERITRATEEAAKHNAEVEKALKAMENKPSEETEENEEIAC